MAIAERENKALEACLPVDQYGIRRRSWDADCLPAVLDELVRMRVDMERRVYLRPDAPRVSPHYSELRRLLRSGEARKMYVVSAAFLATGIVVSLLRGLSAGFPFLVAGTAVALALLPGFVALAWAKARSRLRPFPPSRPRGLRVVVTTTGATAKSRLRRPG